MISTKQFRGKMFCIAYIKYLFKLRFFFVNCFADINVQRGLERLSKPKVVVIRSQ